jgi:hypothetical protein
MALVTAPAALPKQVRETNRQVKVHVQSRNSEKQPIRLTRRGRRVVAILALIPIALTFLLIGTRGAIASDGSAKESTQAIVVQPGQSLWDVAVAVDSEKDPRETIWVIQQLNGMTTSDVLAGQELIVPAN